MDMASCLRKRTEGAFHLLTPQQMYAADAAAIKSGVSGLELMENAGWSIARACASRLAPRHVFVACGPGNNGGDGFVAARLLQDAGWPVSLGLLGDLKRLQGDAASAAARWKGPVRRLAAGLPERTGLVIDALFGAGLSRPVTGEAANLIRRVNALRRDGRLTTIAVDVPSGLDGATGRPIGDNVIEADATVTFFRKKPGHVLMPGRELCGEVIVADIAIPPSVLDDMDIKAFENAPALWRHQLPRAQGGMHKYDRGHLMVLSGPASRTGAARLAAGAGLRAGAGLVTLASPSSAILVNAAHLTAIMLARVDAPDDLKEEIAARRIRVLVMGPAMGVNGHTMEMTRAALAHDALPLVLDADALSVFLEAPHSLFEAARGRAGAVVLTPHEGEFARLFPDLSASSGQDKITRARQAARISGAIIVLKGHDTVITTPAGEAIVNTNAPPWLATAGSGDVLAGAVGALLAQGMDAASAAAAAVWLHGKAGRDAGPALTAEDLPRAIGEALSKLQGAENRP